MPSSYWFILTYHSSWWSTCQNRVAHMQNIPSDPSHVRPFHTCRDTATTMAETSLGRCISSHAIPCRNSKQQRACRPSSLGHCLRPLCALLQAVGSNARVACPLARWLSTVLFLQQAVGFNARGIESTRPLTASASILHHFLIVDILGHDTIGIRYMGDWF